LHDFGAAADILWQKLAALFSEVFEDRSRLEHADRLAAASRIVINNRGDAVVG